MLGGFLVGKKGETRKNVDEIPTTRLEGDGWELKSRSESRDNRHVC